MKVLIVRGFPEKLNIDSYNVQEIGLAKALRKKNIACDIVYFGGKDGDHQNVLSDGTVIYWLHGHNILKNGIMPGVKKLTEGYDVIQVQEYDQLQSWLLYTFSKKPVVIYHGPYRDSFNRGYNAKCSVFDHAFLLLSGKAKKRTWCLAKSPMAAEFLEEKGFRHVKSVGVGLDAEAMGRDEPLTNGNEMEQRVFNLLYVGKLEERRNISFLLNVIRRLSEDLPPYPSSDGKILKSGRLQFHCTIVGSGSPEYMEKVEPVLQKLEEQGILTYIQKLSQRELAPFYRQADLFLFPTNYDIFGMVLLEAMYYGCVCVSSRNGGAAALIQPDNGVILDSFDEKEWSEAVVGLASNPERLADMKRNAAREIREQYLWDDLADTFIQTYRKSIDSANG